MIERMKRHALVLGGILTVFAAPAAMSEETISQISLAAPVTVELAIRSPAGATPEQTARYQARIERIRTHHLALPTRIALAPFSTLQSANRQIIRPKTEALFSEGIDVRGKLDVTAKSKMDYNFVSPVAEPSAAKRGSSILVTFNWGAAWSNDGGETFSQLDPYALFANPVPTTGGAFCCDQVAIYSKSHDLMIWFLQGVDGGQGNTVRLLVARGDDIPARRWKAHDFSPWALGGWTNEWFDYPDMALSERHLFITTNTFASGPGGGFTRSVVLRLPLDELAAGGTVNASIFSSDSTEDFSPRLSQGAGKKMFWASHRDTATFAVRSWADDMPRPDRRRVVSVERWTRPDDVTVRGSEGPNGRPWLNRVDERITAGWASGEVVGFGWTSGSIQGSGGAAAYPFPHIRVAILHRADLETASPATLTPAAQPHLWSSKFAFAYAAAAPNANGEVGVGLLFGGKTAFPSAAVGLFRNEGNDWKTVLTVLSQGRNTPRCRTGQFTFNDKCGAWGDYVGIRPDPADASGWIVATHTAQDTGKEQPKVAVTFAPFKVNGPGAGLQTPSAAVAPPGSR